MQDRANVSAGRRPTLVYLRQQVVNLDRIAEISIKRGRLTLCFAFARLGEPGARLMLSPAEAEPLRVALQDGGTALPAWVAVEDRLINLDLAVDIRITHEQVTVVSALPDQGGGPLPRSFARPAARSLLSYFEQAGTLSLEGRPDESAPGWVRAGDHLLNLGLVSSVRLGAQQVQLAFAGLPRFARAVSYREARTLIEWLQQSGALPIDALSMGEAPDQEPEVDGTGRGSSAMARRRRLGGWLGRRRG